MTDSSLLCVEVFLINCDISLFDTLWQKYDKDIYDMRRHKYIYRDKSLKRYIRYAVTQVYLIYCDTFLLQEIYLCARQCPKNSALLASGTRRAAAKWSNILFFRNPYLGIHISLSASLQHKSFKNKNFNFASQVSAPPGGKSSIGFGEPEEGSKPLLPKNSSCAAKVCD